MKKSEIAEIVKEFAPVVRKFVEKEVAVLTDRLAALEQRPVAVKGDDGIGISGAIIDRDDALILTLTDGKALNLGRVVGDPGKAGEPPDSKALAASIDEVVAKRISHAVDNLTLPEGKPGKPGEPGVGFDDLEEEISDDGRVVIRRYKRGAEVKEFRHRVPCIIYRGIYKDDQDYDRGDLVTWAGSIWHCNAPTNTKPGSSEQWQLAAKHGRDAKPVDKAAVVDTVMELVKAELEKLAGTDKARAR